MHVDLVRPEQHESLVDLLCELYLYHHEDAADEAEVARADSRGRGLGRILAAWIARDAAAQGCGRIDWHVQASNGAGIRFYAGLGAQRVADRLSYRLALRPAAPQDVMRFQPDRTAAFMRSHVDEPLLP